MKKIMIAASIACLFIAIAWFALDRRGSQSPGTNTTTKRAAAEVLQSSNGPTGAASNGSALNANLNPADGSGKQSSAKAPSAAELFAAAPPEVQDQLRRDGIPPIPAGTNTLKTPITISGVKGKEKTVWVVTVEETNDELLVRYISTNSQLVSIPRNRVVKIGAPSLDWVGRGVNP